MRWEATSIQPRLRRGSRSTSRKTRFSSSPECTPGENASGHPWWGDRQGAAAARIRKSRADRIAPCHAEGGKDHRRSHAQADQARHPPRTPRSGWLVDQGVCQGVVEPKRRFPALRSAFGPGYDPAVPAFDPEDWESRRLRHGRLSARLPPCREHRLAEVRRWAVPGLISGGEEGEADGPNRNGGEQALPERALALLLPHDGQFRASPWMRGLQMSASSPTLSSNRFPLPVSKSHPAFLDLFCGMEGPARFSRRIPIAEPMWMER